MKKTTKILAMAMLLLSSTNLTAQGNVQWGDLEKSEGRLIDILPRNANDFFALRRSGKGSVFSKLMATRHVGMAAAAAGKFEIKVNGSPATYEGSAILGEKYVVFLSDKDKKSDQNSFFLQEYSNEIEPVGPTIELASYDMSDRKRRFQGDFKFRQSRDREYLAVIWTLPGQKDEEFSYGFRILNSKLETVSEGTYEVPFDQRRFAINSFYLSNTGDLFVTVTEYGEAEKKGLFKHVANQKATHIYQITEEGLDDMVIDLEGKRIRQMAVNSDNNQIFTIAGIYGEPDKGGVKGLFYLKLDFKNKEITTEGFDEFGDDFITQDWSDRQKNKMEKKKAKGKDVEPKLYNYSMRQVEVLDDGGIVGSMEQYYVVVNTYRDPRTGATTTTYTYYYNDIITFKVGPDGGFDWKEKLQKRQVSTNDGGYFSSYCRFLDGDKLYFIFNDNEKNYDESGDFIDGDKLYNSTISKRKNVVAVVAVDLEDGAYTRKTFFSREDVESVAVPRLFNVDYVNKEVLLYTINGNKEKFGIMTIEE